MSGDINWTELFCEYFCSIWNTMVWSQKMHSFWGCHRMNVSLYNKRDDILLAPICLHNHNLSLAIISTYPSFSFSQPSFIFPMFTLFATYKFFPHNLFIAFSPKDGMMSNTKASKECISIVEIINEVKRVELHPNCYYILIYYFKYLNRHISYYTTITLLWAPRHLTHIYIYILLNCFYIIA